MPLEALLLVVLLAWGSEERPHDHDHDVGSFPDVGGAFPASSLLEESGGKVQKVHEEEEGAYTTGVRDTTAGKTGEEQDHEYENTIGNALGIETGGAVSEVNTNTKEANAIVAAYLRQTPSYKVLHDKVLQSMVGMTPTELILYTFIR